MTLWDVPEVLQEMYVNWGGISRLLRVPSSSGMVDSRTLSYVEILVYLSAYMFCLSSTALVSKTSLVVGLCEWWGMDCSLVCNLAVGFGD